MSGQIDSEHYGPIGDAARHIASYCEGDARRHVYLAAFNTLTRAELAAPELLEALEWIDRNPRAHRENILSVVRDVIAKAKAKGAMTQPTDIAALRAKQEQGA